MSIFDSRVMAQRCGYANFGAFAAELIRQNKTASSNQSDEIYRQTSRKAQLHEILGLDWYYGGWMEDRSVVWADTYLKRTGNFLHLGIDCSVPAGTEVFAVAEGETLCADTDSPLKGGWGGYVIQRIRFRGEACALIYAHLGHGKHQVPKYADKGATLGFVGERSENGAWGEHLHLQLIRDIDDITDWKRFIEDETRIDGYGNVADITYWAKRCPDPTPLIF